jgi:hypothetical protein
MNSQSLTAIVVLGILILSKKKSILGRSVSAVTGLSAASASVRNSTGLVAPSELRRRTSNDQLSSSAAMSANHPDRSAGSSSHRRQYSDEDDEEDMFYEPAELSQPMYAQSKSSSSGRGGSGGGGITMSASTASMRPLSQSQSISPSTNFAQNSQVRHSSASSRPSINQSSSTHESMMRKSLSSKQMQSNWDSL